MVGGHGFARLTIHKAYRSIDRRLGTIGDAQDSRRHSISVVRERGQKRMRTVGEWPGLQN